MIMVMTVMMAKQSICCADQQDADEDELEPDELPEWKREPPAVDMTKLNPDNPEDFLKMSKKGRTLMMFATVAGKTGGLID